MNPIVKGLLTTLGAVAVACVLASSVGAQWTPFVDARVPKGPDGKPVLIGPPPRTADGKVDFSGIWIRGDGRLGPAGGGNYPGPAPAFTAGPPVTTFANVAANMTDDLPLRPWAAELLKSRRATNSKDNPDAHCLPMGLMQFHNHGQPRKIVQTSTLLMMVYEANYGLRQIFLDGRQLPGKDAEPWWYGYSVGHWEGDTLVVNTTGFKDGGWLDVIGHPMTDAAIWTERFRRPTYGTLEIDVTVDDAKAYTKPWTVRVNQRLVPNTDLIEFICNENQQFDVYLQRQK
jgi:hypothetical protein